MVSIIIPLYNVEQYVEASLMSAFNQTFKDIEYILVNDCSTDKTMEVVNKVIANSSRHNYVRIIQHERNRGLSAARNTGMEYAKGDFFFFMDSDDEISPDCIEKHYIALKDTEADFTIANICLEGAKSIHVKSISNEVKRLPLKVSYFKRMWSVSACNKLYKKSFIEKYSLIFQEGLLHEDILWSYAIVMRAKRAAWVDATTYVYKIHPNSITTHKNNSRKIGSLLFILRQIYMDWEKDNMPSEYEADFFRFIDFWRLNTALLLLNYNGGYKECQNYYSQIVKLIKVKRYNMYSCILRLPFSMFFLLVKPAYYLYKNR